MANIRQLAGHAAVAALMTVASVAVQAQTSAIGKWKEINPKGSVRGADGAMHSASCSAIPGTDPSFRFWTRKGSSKNLMVYFEGGGACWDDFSCSFPFNDIPLPPDQLPKLYSPSAPPSGSPGPAGGVFDAANAGNPLADWSAVYIPYCTGDLHAGKATNTYVNYFGSPSVPAGSFTVRHNGFSNFMVVLDWIKQNMAPPDNLLVTGISAGGYGASFNFPWLARAYPKAKLHVLADASQGVTTPAWDAGTPGRGSWNLQYAPGVYGSDPSTVAGPDILMKGAQAFPNARVAQFTTTFDLTQIQFYGLMLALGYGTSNCPTNLAVDWNRQMVAKLGDYAGLSNFRYYLAPGQYHTILRSDGFYTESGAGPLFSSWLGQMVNGGTGWNNAGALVSPPCPPQ